MNKKYTNQDFLSLFAEDLEIAQAVSESFIQTYPILKSKAQFSISGSNPIDAKMALHALKGAVSIFCEDSLNEEIKKIEELAKSGDLTYAKSSFEKIEPQMDWIFSEVKNFLNRIGSSAA